MRILLLTPPLTQLNTPYPATSYLSGFLRSKGIDAVQSDLGIGLALQLFSKKSLERIEKILDKLLQSREPKSKKYPPILNFFLENAKSYQNTVECVVKFLQGKDPTLSLRILSRDFLPEGPRFNVIEQQNATFEGGALYWAFGSLGIQDQAKYLASLFIDDLADLFKEVDSGFGLSRYQEKLAASAPSFDPILAKLEGPTGLLDSLLDELSAQVFDAYQPDCVGISVPFPGNVYGAFRIANQIKKISKNTQLILGGGYVNTELRSLNEPRVFDYFDYVCLDDGERPILAVLEQLKSKKGPLLRTYVREGTKVVFKTDESLHDIPQKLVGVPTYDGLDLRSYISLFEMLNPMHRIWSDGRWNKLTLAHGCYWKKCSFCDTSLDYIGRYDPASADMILDRIEKIITETGQTGFHFVDEAAPPALLRALAEKLIERRVQITWWGNIRFERNFNPELTALLAKSGCIAVTGGLEVASDRLLKLMKKGVTVEQVARVTRAFADAGVLVHAYLMYGFPTQTEQETIDSLERVRQLFLEGCLQSAFWHRFSVTAHSPIGKDPKAYGIELLPEPAVTFARNDLLFFDSSDVDHDGLGHGLNRALYNYMHGVGLGDDVRKWFKRKVPKAKVARNLVRNAIKK